MKNLATFLLAVFASAGAVAQPCTELFISEYIEGSSNNKALEIYNPSNAPISMQGYSLKAYNNGGTSVSNSIDLPNKNLAAGATYVIANPSADPAVQAVADTTSTITYYNGDDAIVLFNNTDTLDIIGVVGVDPGSEWTVGTGATKEYTLVRKSGIQEGQKNWTVGATEWDVYPQNTFTYLGAHTSVCAGPVATIMNIADYKGVDANGEADSANVDVAFQGIVYTIDFDGNTGLSFWMQDATAGINVYNFADVDNYVVTQGDEIYVEGSIDQFNGLTEIFVDSIYVVSTGNALPMPAVSTVLDESTEGNYTQLNNVTLVNPSQWPAAGSSANVDVTDGNDTLTVRIDSDTDIDGSTAPAGTFNVRGAGGQYDSSSPYNDGYQLQPSSLADIMPVTIAAVDNIADYKGVDANGVADSANVDVAFQGIVYTIDFDGNTGLSFWMQDATAGINVYNFADVDNYVVTQGDEIYVEGSIDQFNGLTEIFVDSIYVVSTGNALPMPAVSTVLDESTEGNYTQLNNVTLVNPSQWPAAGSSANVDVTDGNDTLTVRIDSDTDIDGSTAPAGTFNVRGAGGQYDSSSPYDDGYQLQPSSLADIMPASSNGAVPLASVVTTDANGVADSLNKTVIVEGYVSGNNLRTGGASGVEFWLIDDMNTAGLLVRGTSYAFYNVTEGDKIWVRGDIDQYNGLIQLVPDSIMMISSGNTLPAAHPVTSFTEANEGRLLVMNNMTIVSGWPNAGSSSNVTISDGTNTFTLRADSDVFLGDSMATAPSGLVNIYGHQGQFDGSSPYLSGYQINPRYIADIEPVVATSPTVNFESPGQTLTEGIGSVTINLPINPTSSSAETVKVYVQNGANVTAADYTTTPAAVNDTITLSVAAGDSASFQMNVIDDMLTENAETITFTIAKVSGGLTVGATDVHAFTISDNDIIIPTYSISDLKGLDADFIPDSNNVMCKVYGTVLGVDMQGTGSANVSFTIHNGTDGFGVFMPNSTYTVNEGDSVRIIGTVGHFNGLAQMNADSIVLVGTGATLPSPVVFTTLDEAMESNLGRFNNAMIIDPSQWTNSGSGFNVDITNGPDTIVMRIDKDVDLFSQPAPLGTFDVIGIGGQYDNSAPHDEGYQFLPRYMADIIQAAPMTYDLAITEIMPGSNNPNSTVSEDWFEITNYGTTAVDMQGFSWDDDSENPGTSTFGTLTIGAGESVVIWGGMSTDEADFMTEWGLTTAGVNIISSDELTGSFPGLSQNGDAVVLYDTSATAIEICNAAFATATAGFSVEFDTNCVALGNAVDGVNGAYESKGGYDVGSPGNVAPDFSINEFALGTFSIYPNPVQNVLTVELPAGEKTITLLSLTGAALQTINTAQPTATLNMSNLAAGIYLVKVESYGQVAVRKVVKQ